MVASGTVVVEGSVKKVQHPTGGVVGEIRVEEGARVNEGDVLVKLDATMIRANLGIIMSDLNAQRARLARLQAMRDGRHEPVFPADLVEEAKTSPAIRNLLDGEARLCDVALTRRDEQKQQLAQRIEEIRQEIIGLDEQVKSSTGQVAIAGKERDDLAPLVLAGTVQRTRMTALQREVLHHQGFLGESIAKIAQSRARITETQLQIVQSDHDLLADVMKDMRDTENKVSELQERRVAAEDQLQRLDIRAPITGMVHQLAVHTVGGVVAPSEALMMIVPSADRLIVEAKISPADIDQVSPGLPTRVRFTAFNRRTTDEVNGTVVRVGADLSREQQSNQAFYTVAIGVPETEIGGLRLVPGMPAEVFIKTGERTLASYLLKPLTDQMQRAFRER